ncbi:sulfurtransferase [Pseudomonas sp. CrR25]|nr:sulfurtransferase [Pseudomonas sp. CrR25]
MVESIGVADLQAALSDARPPLLCDVRRQAAFAEAPWVIPGALRRLPEEVASWAGELEAGRAVVVYCVHGHEVSQGVARQLVDLGIHARYLRGGIEQWKAEAHATVPLTR